MAKKGVEIEPFYWPYDNYPPICVENDYLDYRDKVISGRIHQLADDDADWRDD